jgi:DUF971 family protein
MNGSREEWPTEIKVVDGGATLAIAFESGARFTLPAEYLRVMSPSAEVRGHGEKERKTIGGKRAVRIIGVEPVGSYAVKLSFDDMHATGLYSWTYLHDLGANQTARWDAYLGELAALGLARDRPGEALANAPR